MQESRKMDLKQIQNVMKEPKVGVVVKKGTPISDDIQHKPELDSGSALQLFLDRIPHHFNSWHQKLTWEAIQMLYERDVCAAPIADALDPDATTIARFSDRYIGFIDFAGVLLWSLHKCEKPHVKTKENGGESFFTMLDQNPQIGHTKIGELATEFLWDPFFPVRLDDTLFHVLLLLSKHRLQVVPVVEQPKSQVIGFVTQVRFSGYIDNVDWFDRIADRALSEFRFENGDHVVQVCGDQSLAEGLRMLCKNQVDAIAVVKRETRRLIGTITRSDIYLLLENDNLIPNKETLTTEEFIHMETGRADSDPTIERDIGALISAGALRLKNSFLPRMDQPVTNKKMDTLKEAMKKLADTKSNFSFLVNDSHQATGLLTIRDIIIQFAPPCIDSSFHGDGFFESALEQTGCKVKNGTIARNS
ncbi:hypothetical protein Pint_34706 [Pistacia integerrima]|uniref:Uncharacterized protein n=1 Tax=Pistacia integerrima TaxID=434235 RepID=A0ACC0X310_9ROSI|nr:hypothetical protein Pint_34706 [Pistacia integerrima]